MKELELKKPITAHGETLSVLEFDEPTGKDVRELGRTKYMVKVLGDKSLGYDENETFQLPEGYDPCKDDVNLEGDTHIEEPIEGLDELFN